MRSRAAAGHPLRPAPARRAAHAARDRARAPRRRRRGARAGGGRGGRAPSSAEAHALLGQRCSGRPPGRSDRRYRAALRREPIASVASAANDLAWILATSRDPALRDPAEALRLAESAATASASARRARARHARRRAGRERALRRGRRDARRAIALLPGARRVGRYAARGARSSRRASRTSRRGDAVSGQARLGERDRDREGRDRAAGAALAALRDRARARADARRTQRRSARGALGRARDRRGARVDATRTARRARRCVHVWELYHHVLGAKYFDELGYTRLYDCTLVADVEAGFAIAPERAADAAARDESRRARRPRARRRRRPRASSTSRRRAGGEFRATSPSLARAVAAAPLGRDAHRPRLQRVADLDDPGARRSRARLPLSQAACARSRGSTRAARRDDGGARSGASACA